MAANNTSPNQSPGGGKYPPHQIAVVCTLIILIIAFFLIIGFWTQMLVQVLVIPIYVLTLLFAIPFFNGPINAGFHAISSWLAGVLSHVWSSVKSKIKSLYAYWRTKLVTKLFILFTAIVISSLITYQLTRIHYEMLNIHRIPYPTPPPKVYLCDSEPISKLPINGIGVTQSSGGECIGISDGNFAFDTDRLYGNLKRQAVEKLGANDTKDALPLWKQESALDTNDAETLIYQENQRIHTSPHITLIIATILTGKYINIGRDNLQGAYVAQKEYNDGFILPGGLQVRLLIANFGSNASEATKVAKQIVQAAKADKTIVGVMGLPFSSYIRDAMNVLDQAHIPMVSQSASSDDLSKISKYFFRIVPPNKVQASIGAQYAINKIHAHKVVLFEDPGDPYSISLGEDFKEKFMAAGGIVIATEPYYIGHPEMLPERLKNAQKYVPDLLYFAGHATDLNTLLVDIPRSELSTHVLVMGGDALYEIKDYTSSASSGFLLLRFTAFAYPDEWMYEGMQEPPFIKEYQAAFDPHKQHSGDPYGYSRADNNVLVSYDALMVLLKAYQTVPSNGKSLLTPAELRDGLTHITGTLTYNGMSGQIAFGSDSDPINKTVVVLYVDSKGFIKLDSIKSCDSCG